MRSLLSFTSLFAMVALAANKDEGSAPAPDAPAPAPTPATAPEFVAKLSVKTMGCNAKLATVGEGEAAKRIPMIRIMGIAGGIKVAEGQDGDPVFGLTGQFEGVNIANGKVYRSGVCYLPAGIQELIQDPLEQEIDDAAGGKSTGEGGVEIVRAKRAVQPIRFAFDIFAVTATNKAGYSFAATEVGSNPTRVDPFAEMRQVAQTVELPKLPAPAAS